MGAIASQITSLTIVYSTVHSDADQRKHQSSASLAFVRGIHRGPVNSRANGQLHGKCFHLMTSSSGACEAAALLSTTPRLRTRSSTNDFAPLRCMGWVYLRPDRPADPSRLHDKRPLSSHTRLVYPPLRAAAMLKDALTRVHFYAKYRGISPGIIKICLFITQVIMVIWIIVEQHPLKCLLVCSTMWDM